MIQIHCSPGGMKECNIRTVSWLPSALKCKLQAQHIPLSCLIETSSLLFDRDMFFMNPLISPTIGWMVPLRDAKEENLLTHGDTHLHLANVIHRSHIPYLRTTQRCHPSC